ncbi:hypothetical protein ACFU99_11575 [Streptomyces sp. NPDC057654]|uniref:hypothetical protein n=1 Tax=Streptomyces sp. NPDC057654 TaxID=3346196 RepID=UPI0036D1BF5C
MREFGWSGSAVGPAVGAGAGAVGGLFGALCAPRCVARFGPARTMLTVLAALAAAPVSYLPQLAAGFGAVEFGPRAASALGSVLPLFSVLTLAISPLGHRHRLPGPGSESPAAHPRRVLPRRPLDQAWRSPP